MDKPTLDLAYDCTLTVSDFGSDYAKMKERGAKAYEKYEHKANIPYGKGDRNTFDLFPSGTTGAPTYIFIHCGYWQSWSKEDFAYVVEGPLSKGFNVVLFEYTIAPKGTMAQIATELYQCLDYLETNAESLGLTKGKICLSGHSAGGHLTLIGKDHPFVSHAFPLSALVELEPISLCFLNDNLSLTKEEIVLYSPIRHTREGVPMAIYVGGYELAEPIRHSEEHYMRMKALGNATTAYSRC